MAHEIMRLEPLLQIVDFNLTVCRAYRYVTGLRINAQLEGKRADKTESLEIFRGPSLCWLFTFSLLG